MLTFHLAAGISKHFRRGYDQPYPNAWDDRPRSLNFGGECIRDEDVAYSTVASDTGVRFCM